MKGSRVRNIVRELNNEKIDIIRWSSDPREFTIEALKPAKAKSVTVDEANHRVHVLVDEAELSIAIGKRGQNARLTSRLTGWDVTIEKAPTGQENFQAQVAEATRLFVEKLGLDEETAKLLIQGGFNQMESIADSEARDIATGTGIPLDRAEEIVRLVKELASSKETAQPES